MYAIIADGGRQFKVEEGQELKIDLRELSTGDKVEFDTVLAYSDGKELKIGTPNLKNAKVLAEVVGPTKGPKLVVQKMRRRKTLRRKTGHRQLYTMVKIEKIAVS